MIDDRGGGGDGKKFLAARDQSIRHAFVARHASMSQRLNELFPSSLHHCMHDDGSNEKSEPEHKPHDNPDAVPGLRFARGHLIGVWLDNVVGSLIEHKYLKC